MVQASKLASKFTLRLMLGLLAVAVVAGCEDDEKIAIAKAEQCLNRATSTTAMDCVSAPALGYSEKAYSLRCSARYLANGFTGATIGQAFDVMKRNPNPAQDPMITTLAFMAFRNNGAETAITAATTAEDECQKSKVLSMMRFSRMSLLATQIGSFGGVNVTDGLSDAEVQTAIDSLQGGINPADAAAIADTVVDAATDYCAAGSNFETTQICKNLETALAGGTSPGDIVTALLAELESIM